MSNAKLIAESGKVYLADGVMMNTHCRKPQGMDGKRVYLNIVGHGKVKASATAIAWFLLYGQEAENPSGLRLNDPNLGYRDGNIIQKPRGKYVDASLQECLEAASRFETVGALQRQEPSLYGRIYKLGGCSDLLTLLGDRRGWITDVEVQYAVNEAHGIRQLLALKSPRIYNKLSDEGRLSELVDNGQRHTLMWAMAQCVSSSNGASYWPRKNFKAKDVLLEYDPECRADLTYQGDRTAICDNDSVYMYYIPELGVYKIGISSYRLGIGRPERTLYVNRLTHGADLILVHVSDARKIERELHTLLKEHKAVNLDSVTDGETEMFVLSSEMAEKVRDKLLEVSLKTRIEDQVRPHKRGSEVD